MRRGVISLTTDCSLLAITVVWCHVLFHGSRQQHCSAAGRRHQKDYPVYAGHQPPIAASLGIGFAISKSPPDCREHHHSKGQFLHEVPAHFDGHLLSPFFDGNSHHGAEHKTTLTSPHLNADPAPVNCGSLTGPR